MRVWSTEYVYMYVDSVISVGAKQKTPAFFQMAVEY